MPELATPAEAGGLDAFRRGQAVLRTMRRVRLGLTLLLFAIIVGFLFAFYGHAKTAWTSEKFEPYAKDELKRLTPVLANAAENVLGDVRPKYEQLIRAKARQVQPELQKTSSKEMLLLFNDADELVQTELRTVVRAAYAHQLNVMKKEFPRLGDEVRTEMLKTRLESGLEKDADAVSETIARRYMKEVQKVQDEMMLFRPSRFDRLSEEDLGRYFIHLWVQLLDMHLMENLGGTDHVK